MTSNAKRRICLLVLATMALTASPGRADDFDWLIGEWTRETRGGIATEVWTRVSDHTLEGSGLFTAGEETRVTEHLRLELFGDEWFYTAKPPVNPYPTPFKLVSTDRRRFVFENPNHDFPQRILYVREDDGGLLVTISRMDAAAADEVHFRFSRAAND